jgi:hypothetical protein
LLLRQVAVRVRVFVSRLVRRRRALQHSDGLIEQVDAG